MHEELSKSEVRDYMTDILKDILQFVQNMGLKNGLFVIFFIFAHYLLFWMYSGRLKDRQVEIDRLAADNKEYRDRFLKLMDNAFSYSPPTRKAAPRKPVNEKEFE
ncbi:hypothetical protein ACJJIW_20630 [Microbulbifer sp. JMSA004]|uniref:hypothetical protein n=1 Tax=unclassified Microbulbifer TaxID=2619833 RepID=UPI0024AD5126|nr:hypothetical protein [Microbulbifer sp. VAAF005]WHI46464.1 hypothetical protein P0078_22600 [Microbulbifer sp. VAAF005]